VGDLGLVGAGVDAQLGGAEVEGLVGVACVGAGGEAGALGQQVGPAGRDVGQLGDSGVVLVGGQGRPAGVTAGGAREPGDDSVVSGVISHRAIVEYVFDFRQVPGLACWRRNSDADGVKEPSRLGQAA
jgi:hypothetical protein